MTYNLEQLKERKGHHRAMMRQAKTQKEYAYRKRLFRKTRNKIELLKNNQKIN